MDIKSYLMEFVGAFFLVFAVGMVTLIPSAGSIAPFVAGLTLLLMITIGGRISGGHYNPAVTLACLLKGDIGSERAFYYWFFQLIGAGIASIIVLFLKDYPSTVSLSVSIGHVFILAFCYGIRCLGSFYQVEYLHHYEKCLKNIFERSEIFSYDWSKSFTSGRLKEQGRLVYPLDYILEQKNLNLKDYQEKKMSFLWEELF